MNKIISIYKSDETIPFLIIRCDEFRTNEEGVFIKRDSVEQFILIDWHYYTEVLIGERGEEVVKLFKKFQSDIEKI